MRLSDTFYIALWNLLDLHSLVLTATKVINYVCFPINLSKCNSCSLYLPLASVLRYSYTHKSKRSHGADNAGAIVAVRVWVKVDERIKGINGTEMYDKNKLLEIR